MTLWRTTKNKTINYTNIITTQQKSKRKSSRFKNYQGTENLKAQNQQNTKSLRDKGKTPKIRDPKNQGQRTIF